MAIVRRPIEVKLFPVTNVNEAIISLAEPPNFDHLPWCL